jgi:hypothetical protein
MNQQKYRNLHRAAARRNFCEQTAGPNLTLVRFDLTLPVLIVQFAAVC